MTVGKLHKLLAELIAKGHERKPVCISKETFKHPLEIDGCTILDVVYLEIQSIEQLDDDGRDKENKDGTIHEKVCCVLMGNIPDLQNEIGLKP